MKIWKVFLVFRKDWNEVERNWQVLLPVVVVPVFFSMALPLIIYLSPMPSSSLGPFQNFFDVLPHALKEKFASFTSAQLTFYMVVMFFFSPFFIVIPLIASSVIASDSFAGEKERKTIEALLATPLTDGELLMGKMLVSFATAMLATLASFLVYSAVSDTLAIRLFNYLIMPDTSWLMLIFFLAPAVAFVSIGMTVTISAKVKGFREAQQINAIIIIPILVAIFGETWVAMIQGPIALVSLASLFIALDVIMMVVGLKLFKREEILPKI